MKKKGSNKTAKRSKNRKKLPSTRLQRRKSISRPKTTQEFFALPQAQQERWNRVAQAINKMQTAGLSLPNAAREYGLEPRILRELGRDALQKQSNGRFIPKGRNDLLRILTLPARGGSREVAVNDSATASILGSFNNAVQIYLRTGDKRVLKPFRLFKLKDANGKPIRLLTDTKEIDRLASAGVVSFESFYGRSK